MILNQNLQIIVLSRMNYAYEHNILKLARNPTVMVTIKRFHHSQQDQIINYPLSR